MSIANEQREPNGRKGFSLNFGNTGRPPGRPPPIATIARPAGPVGLASEWQYE